jgi:hypothetical protein
MAEEPSTFPVKFYKENSPSKKADSAMKERPAVATED